ncbi:MAG: hypothetical protein AB1472_05615 [Candidatus Omnitrophota bacterium]
MKVSIESNEHKNRNLKKTIAREGLIFLALFGISYLVYLVIRLNTWIKKRRKKDTCHINKE